MPYRACVWDMDGTLLNTLPTILYYCNQSLAHFGLHSIAMEDCRDLCRLPISHFYHRLLRMWNGYSPRSAIMTAPVT